MKGYIGIVRSDGTYSVKEYGGDYDRIVDYYAALIFGHVDNKNSPVIVTDSKEHLVSIFESMGIYEES